LLASNEAKNSLNGSASILITIGTAIHALLLVFENDGGSYSPPV